MTKKYGDLPFEETMARLAELDAGNIPADIDTLLVRLPAILSAARIGYLDNINNAQLLQLTAARLANLDTTAVGRLQTIATTIDLNQAAATYVLLTANTQDVVVESLVIRMSGGAVGGAVTSISIQTDDATPIIFISAADGAVANLTDEAQLAWTGAVLMDAGTAATIGLTIAGGAAGVARVCDVVVGYRAVVAGGLLI